MSALTEKVAQEHQRQDGAAGDGHYSPRESWTHCSCGADIWAWQQFYAETDEDPDESWTQHIAAVTEQAVRAELAEAWERGFMCSYGLDRGCTVAESHDLSPYRPLRNDLRIWNPYTDDTDEEDPYE